MEYLCVNFEKWMFTLLRKQVLAILGIGSHLQAKNLKNKKMLIRINYKSMTPMTESRMNDTTKHYIGYM